MQVLKDLGMLLLEGLLFVLSYAIWLVIVYGGMLAWAWLMAWPWD